MAKMPRSSAPKKPPVPSGSHAEIEEWMRRVMPELNPIIAAPDASIRKAIPGLEYAVKWKKAYYGVPERGWIIELAAYDVSANIVFLGGADFENPPPLGEGRSRYVKVRSVEEASAPEVQEWISTAARLPGWT